MTLGQTVLEIYDCLFTNDDDNDDDDGHHIRAKRRKAFCLKKASMPSQPIWRLISLGAAANDETASAQRGAALKDSRQFFGGLPSASQLQSSGLAR